MTILPINDTANVQSLVHQSEFNHREHHKGYSVLQVIHDAMLLF
jgi:hypothetical protein